jgi:hypothetical protein
MLSPFCTLAMQAVVVATTNPFAAAWRVGAYFLAQAPQLGPRQAMARRLVARTQVCACLQDTVSPPQLPYGMMCSVLTHSIPRHVDPPMHCCADHRIGSLARSGSPTTLDGSLQQSQLSDQVQAVPSPLVCAHAILKHCLICLLARFLTVRLHLVHVMPVDVLIPHVCHLQARSAAQE